MTAKNELSHYPHIDNIVDPHGMYQLMQSFLEHLAILNYSSRTVETREKALLQFIEWCGQRRLIRPTEINKPILERYQRHLFMYRKKDGAPLSFGSQRGRLTGVKMWFKWLTRQNYLTSNPASELELAKLPRKLPKAILSLPEVESTLSQPDISKALGLRDRAILETLYSTGIRRQELIGLRVEDIDRDLGTLFVARGKGNKERIIPIGERAVLWIDKYLDESRCELTCGQDDNALFLNYLGKGIDGGSITHMVRDYLNKAQVSKPGSAHLFRHTMATMMLENGADIRFIQAMLGHASLEATQVYTRVSVRKLKEVHTRTHPAKVKPTVEDDGDTLMEEILFQALAAENDEGE